MLNVFHINPFTDFYNPFCSFVTLPKIGLPKPHLLQRPYPPTGSVQLNRLRTGISFCWDRFRQALTWHLLIHGLRTYFVYGRYF